MAEYSITAAGTAPVSNRKTDFYNIEISFANTHYGYGYGYGYFDSTDYFDVLSLIGTTSGYGHDSILPGATYDYGWGYEQSNVVAGDGSVYIEVIATVTKNDEALPNEKVTFRGGPSVSFNMNTAITDSNGNATVRVYVDSSEDRNLDEEGNLPKYTTRGSGGYVAITASINRDSPEGYNKKEISTFITQDFGEDAFSIFTVYSYGWMIDA